MYFSEGLLPAFFLVLEAVTNRLLLRNIVTDKNAGMGIRTEDL
jgi:hypothetical protein